MCYYPCVSVMWVEIFLDVFLSDVLPFYFSVSVMSCPSKSIQYQSNIKTTSPNTWNKWVSLEKFYSNEIHLLVTASPAQSSPMAKISGCVTVQTMQNLLSEKERGICANQSIMHPALCLECQHYTVTRNRMEEEGRLAGLQLHLSNLYV